MRSIREVWAGGGTPRRDPNGTHKKYGAAEHEKSKPRLHAKWKDSWEYEVPGLGNNFRILVNPYGDIGWTNSHYSDILETGLKVGKK